MPPDSGPASVDAVVIGAGHNGLVAAAVLADAGWDVLVLEAQPDPGGAVRSAELIPGYVSDLYSAFYPMSVVSPAIRALHLEEHGLRWSHAPAALGHPRNGSDDDAPVIYRDPARTANELGRRDAHDGDNWWRLVELWKAIRAPLLSTLFAPFPPLRGPIQLLRKLGTAEALRLVRLLMLPASVMADELFDGDAARLLLLGNALHADVPIDAPGSGVMGFLMLMLAQDTGFPVPVGGAGQLTAALVRRATSGRGAAAVRRSRRVPSTSAVITRWRCAPPAVAPSVCAALWWPTSPRPIGISGCCRGLRCPSGYFRI